MSTATLPPPVRATIDDLMKVEGKAELISGKVVMQMPAGNAHNQIAGRIYVSLFLHATSTGTGTAYTDNGTFRIPELVSGRESFSADSAYVNRRVPISETGPIEGSPTFAVEVRSPDQYGRAAEKKLAEKCDDYFEAGSIAVWDVDPKKETVTLHLNGVTPVIFHRGETAHAEPAVPGWSMTVDSIFN